MTSARRHKGLLAAAAMGARIDHQMGRARDGALGFVQGFLETSLSPPDMQALTARLYDLGPQTYDSQAGLMEWERHWFEAALPGPPARILVGGAGAGREVLALQAMGHEVDAFDPAPGLVARCRSLAGCRVALGDYGMLASSVLDGSGGTLASFSQARYDAVILGWTSLSHVFTVEDQARTLAAVDVLCPAGPVLASFLMRGTAALGVATRAERLGTRLARVTGAEDYAAERRPLRFFWHCGFVYLFSENELHGLAAGVGRQAHLETEPYPRATFVRLDEAPAARESARAGGV